MKKNNYDDRQVVLASRKFTLELGCKIAKLRYTAPLEGLEDVWEKYPPLTFKEIAELTNQEDRRVAFLYFGLERLMKEANPTLVNKATITKNRRWMDQPETLYADTYELYKVDKETLDTWQDCYFVRCKDTSTDREYLIWTKATEDPIEAIAWTIQIPCPPEDVQQIFRQGDCILVQLKPEKKPGVWHHLDKESYLKLVTAES